MLMVQPLRNYAFSETTLKRSVPLRAVITIIIYIGVVLNVRQVKNETLRNSQPPQKKYYGLDFSQNDVIIELINKGSFLIGEPVSF